MGFNTNMDSEYFNEYAGETAAAETKNETAKPKIDFSEVRSGKDIIKFILDEELYDDTFTLVPEAITIRGGK